MRQASSVFFPAVLQSSPAALTHVRVQFHYLRCIQVEELHVAAKLREKVEEYQRESVSERETADCIHLLGKLAASLEPGLKT